MPRTEAQHDGAVNGLHRFPMAVEIDANVLVAVARDTRFGIGDETARQCGRDTPRHEYERQRSSRTPYFW